MSDDNMTYKQFCKRYGITAKAEWVDSNPNMRDWTDANHFKVKLLRRDPTNGSRRSMTLYFSQGYGINGEPTADSVLECLARDASVDNYTFEEWCSDLGYDEDSRKALATFNACIRQRDKLERFLGPERLEALLECEE